MRRPLKPFVTEYKGSRRGSPALSEPPSFESERPAPRPAEVKLRAEADGEDSYEAAMRAADALFSSRSDQSDARVDTQRASTSEQPEAGAAPERGGRILRVIDEAPHPQHAALEAEFAPKRRGRKPGSKNKPKVGVTPTVSPPSPAQVAEAPIALPPGVPVPAQHQVVALASAAVTRTSRVEKRSAWARGKLKPGEDWKRRRLPRVCW